MPMRRPLTALLSTLGLVFSLLLSPLASAADSVEVNGVIESVIHAKQMLKVTHDPVPEWGWMKMKMKFAVADGVDLSALKEGQAASLTLEKGADGKVTITAIK